MIRLTRPPRPAVLTPDFEINGTARFQFDGSAVWNVDGIKTALSAMSAGKCAYCETKLGQGAAYLEVEHFYAKDHHPGRVLEWENLLPACRRCNGRKGAWDVAVQNQMMIDPVSTDPVVHIRLDEAYRPVGRTPEGETTVIEVALDDILRLGVPRYTLGETYKRKIEELRARYDALTAASPNRTRRAVVRAVKEALELCRPDAPLSAVVATVLARSADYTALKDAMAAAGDWDGQLQADDAIAAAASLA